MPVCYPIKLGTDVITLAVERLFDRMIESRRSGDHGRGGRKDDEKQQ